MSERKPILDVAIKVSDALINLSDGTQVHEAMYLDTNTAAVVFDVGGVDYIATVMRLPKQRQRPQETPNAQ